MRFPRRRHQRPQPTRNSSTGALAEGSKVDLWISRLASISQFGLFLLTIGGFYFTVLPLYQKALLEEAIAKKETELKEVSAALEESYGRVRGAAVKEFVFGVGASCSGLMLPSRNLQLLGQNIPNRKSHAEEVLEIEPERCLVEATSKYAALRNLRPDDMKLLKAAAADISRELDQKRTALISEVRSSWGSSEASRKANAYGELVRSRVLTLRDLPWKK